MKNGWFCIGANKKRIVAGVLLAAVCCFAPFGLICPNYHEGIVFKLLYALGFIVPGLVSVKLSKKSACVVYPLLAVAAAAVTACLSQLICSETLHLPSMASFLLTTLCIFILYCAVYVITASTRWSIVIGSAAVILLSVANVLVMDFQGNSLTPTAILGFRTAMDVLSNYKIELNTLTVRGIVLTLVICFGVFSFKAEKLKRPAALYVRAAGLAATVLLSFALVHLTADMVPLHWKDRGTIINGYVLNFVLEIKELRVAPPDDYSAETIKELENEYETENPDGIDKPDIIVIMNEAFSDLNVYGAELETDPEVLPFFDSLTDNTVRGWTYSSVYGGLTADSEWEMLTGNSMAFMPTGTIPYQQYANSVKYSLVEYLESLGYESWATHPCSGANWNRTDVYNRLGFDRSVFYEEYPKEDLIRTFITDREMYKLMLDRYEQQPEDKPLFMFGVTVQNHGGYFVELTGDIDPLTLEGPVANDFAENYLTLIHESDKAFETLIHELEKSDRPTVVLMFGDHQPALDMEFLEQLYGGPLETLDEQMLMYKIPFVIWANYDIEEKTVDCTSMNFLSDYLMEAAGLPLSAYQSFLQDLESRIPVINSNGYYSLTEGCFLPISEAQGEEKTALDLYAQLQYNSMFDTKHRSEVFFPVP